jgi:hypothetical protein
MWPPDRASFRVLWRRGRATFCWTGNSRNLRTLFPSEIRPQARERYFCFCFGQPPDRVMESSDHLDGNDAPRQLTSQLEKRRGIAQDSGGMTGHTVAPTHDGWFPASGFRAAAKSFQNPDVEHNAEEQDRRCHLARHTCGVAATTSMPDRYNDQHARRNAAVLRHPQAWVAVPRSCRLCK